MQPYEVAFSGEAVRALLGSKPARQRQAESAVELLQNDPFRNPDFNERLLDGRDAGVLMVGNTILTFHVDHAVREVRIFRIEFV